MTLSMTAFSRQQIDRNWGSLTWEIRSVNHRYLEPGIRLPDTMRSLEPVIRESLRKKLSRGKVDCQLRFQANEASENELAVDENLIAQLSNIAATVRTLSNDCEALSTGDILRWPGVLIEPQLDAKEIEAAAIELFHSALAELVATRSREGVELESMIASRLTSIADIVTSVREKMPEIMAKQRENLLLKVSELGSNLDAGRLEQEVALLAQKADVDEELDRLDAHLKEVSRVLAQSGAKGRRLDFLMQELNREANTLSSKSIVTETTLSAVELKVLIEQMREQIQNIE
ncbi:MAG: hypothetical protein DHS20C12_08940 [Pseudohongiella sp.]|nr:MAG: hypothetical protein DHS20C12_08940 [Pseudohongiella sp.]